MLVVLNDLFDNGQLTAEDCCEVAGERLRWGERLVLVLASKSVDEEARQLLEKVIKVLKKHGCRVKYLKRKLVPTTTHGQFHA